MATCVLLVLAQTESSDPDVASLRILTPGVNATVLLRIGEDDWEELGETALKKENGTPFGVEGLSPNAPSDLLDR